MRKLLVASALAALLGGAAMAADVKIEEVKVDTDLTAIKNPDAARFYANLSSDLTNAITARLTNGALVEDGGSKINVKIDALELANTWQALNDFSKSQLRGVVNETSDTDNSKFNNYELTVSYDNIIAVLPAGSDPAALSHDSGRYYKAMVETFANEVVQRLK